MFLDSDLLSKAATTLDCARQKRIKIATAESCTGGMVATYLTEIAGASDVFERGFVTYSNQAKIEMLQVDKMLLKDHGAVSLEVAKAMAIGVIKNSTANLSVAITGIAGPGGGNNCKSIGLVYVASFCSLNEKLLLKKFNFIGSRSCVRKSSVNVVFDLLLMQINEIVM